MTGLLISRRSLLKIGALAGLTPLLKAAPIEALLNRLPAQEMSRVVWVQNSQAALGWNSQYAQRVNATAANEMMDLAIQHLTGQSSIEVAWDALFRAHNGGSGYLSGQQIAIKLNFNNAYVENHHNPNYQVVNALLRHLVEVVGVRQNAIILYDATREFEIHQPQFVEGIRARFPQVQMNPAVVRTFQAPVWGTKLTALLNDVQYVINMPLLRQHDGAGVSLGFKNHLGSVQTPSALHTGLNQPSENASSLVELNALDTVRRKTMLTIADALYGVRKGGPSAAPAGNTGIINPFPNSIFMSADPVAVDAVMLDYLANRNVVLTATAHNYLIRAQTTGLGTYETALDYNYQTIDLVHCVDGTCDGPPLPPPVTLVPSATPLTARSGCHPQSPEEGGQDVLCVSS